MKNLLIQIIKFGLVGGICFVIDYLIGLGVLNALIACTSDEFFETASVIAAAVGFTVSVVVNYFLSFKFVFARKQDLNRKAEFVAFIILSVIGLGLNSFLIWVTVGPIFSASIFLQEHVGYNLLYTIAKVFATAVVMVYNFVTRKIFLEQKESQNDNI